MDDAQLARYLAILGVTRRAPSESLLREVVAAHLARIPFENVSKLYWLQQLGLAGVPDLALYLEGIERYGFGGTCYANNGHLHALLAALGFEATLCGADMAAPNVHVVVRVEVEGREFYADAGYAAPFWEPLPADHGSDHVLAWGRERYVLAPKDRAGRSRMELWRAGERKHGYVVNPEQRRLADFAAQIADSFRPAATFLNALLLARFSAERSVVVRNLSLTEAGTGRFAVRQFRDRADLAAGVERHFGIAQAIVCGVLEDLPALVDP
jgi:arylamine N-acetyltransferase